MSEQPTVIVTGGASGIGLAVVKAILDRGWRAVVVDRDARNLDRCKAALARSDEEVRFQQLDVADEAAVTKFAEQCDAEFGPVTGLVNSAGIGTNALAMETTADLFRKILDVNLVGSFVISREVARQMRKRSSGSIVNIASVSGIRGNIGRTAYGASKGGMITMTKIMAIELASSGIRINAVAPGPIETPLSAEMHTEQTRSDWREAVPQRRYGTPEEIAGGVMFLLDNAQSSFVTGQTICVDGGFTAAGLMGRSASAAQV